MIDSYILDIAEKDQMSQLLADLSKPTLQREFICPISAGKNGISVIKIPNKYVLVGFSSGGNYRLRDTFDYSESVMKDLVFKTSKIGVMPLAMANVIDAQSIDEEFIRDVQEPIVEYALKHKFAILNGELAKLGNMMNCPCNITATMIGATPRDKVKGNLPYEFKVANTKYFVFDPKEKMVWLNSDGIGTKSLINARFKKYEDSINDLFAMQYDDRGKLGGGAFVSFNIIESNGNIPFNRMQKRAGDLASRIGSYSVLQHEDVGDRIVGPHSEKNVFNGSGTLVSLIDEESISRLPKPHKNDYLIAIRGYGRSNGFTDRRNLMVEWLGENWHETLCGKAFGEFLTIPSLIFYPVFAELISKNIATSCFHMSGGTYRDKLAKILKRNGLYVEIGIHPNSPDLYKPDPRETAFCSHFSTVDAYSKFAIGNEAFITTHRPKDALKCLKKEGFEAKIVSVLQEKNDVSGLKLKAFNGEIISFVEKMERLL